MPVKDPSKVVPQVPAESADAALKHIVDGFLRFHHDVFPEQQELFKKLATAQTPRAMFITCADSVSYTHLDVYKRQGPLDEAHKRQAKRAEFERLRREYRQVRDGQWGGDKRYDAWVYGPLNNAKLLPFGLYDQWVPAFEALFREVGRDWGRFYERVEQLGRLPIADRTAALQRLMVNQ